MALNMYFYFLSHLLYGVALVGAIANLYRQQSMSLFSKIWVSGIVIQTLSIAIRFVEAGRPPWSNFFESILFMVWVIAVVGYVYYRYSKIELLILAINLLTVALMAINYAFPSDIHHLMPALQSYWLLIHVTTVLAGYAIFCVAAVVGALYFWKNRSAKVNLPSGEVIEELGYKIVLLGFPVFALGGLLFGSIWAHEAWGRFWFWDPKETWALIIFLYYAMYLHLRNRDGFTAKHGALMLVGGFFVIMFSYFGVNLLISGLHTYAGS
jgi:cytochrome c-type biogenesis protein CcsB